MAEGAGRESWNHTASLLTLLANVNRNSKKKAKPYQLSDFHPHRTEKQDSGGLKICKSNKSMLKMLVKALARKPNDDTSPIPKDTTAGRNDHSGDLAPGS